MLNVAHTTAHTFNILYAIINGRVQHFDLWSQYELNSGKCFLSTALLLHILLKCFRQNDNMPSHFRICTYSLAYSELKVPLLVNILTRTIPPPPFSTHTVRILLLDAEHIVFVVTLTFHCDTHTHPMHTYPSYNCPLNGNAFSLANQLFPLYLMMCATIQVRKHFKIIFFIRLRWIFHVTSIWYMFDLCDFCHFYRISSHTHTPNFLVNCFPQNVIWTIAVASTKNSTATKLIVRFFCSCVCVCVPCRWNSISCSYTRYK